MQAVNKAAIPMPRLTPSMSKLYKVEVAAAHLRIQGYNVACFVEKAELGLTIAEAKTSCQDIKP